MPIVEKSKKRIERDGRVWIETKYRIPPEFFEKLFPGIQARLDQGETSIPAGYTSDAIVEAQFVKSGCAVIEFDEKGNPIAPIVPQIVHPPIRHI